VTSSARVVEMCAAVPERVLEEEVGRSRGGGHAQGAWRRCGGVWFVSRRHVEFATIMTLRPTAILLDRHTFRDKSHA
jgi:hypothetical protein